MKRIITIIVVGGVIIAGLAFQLWKNHAKINNARSNSGISNIVNVNVAKVTKSLTVRELNLTGILYPGNSNVWNDDGQNNSFWLLIFFISFYFLFKIKIVKPAV